MLNKQIHTPTVNIITLGCSKNLVDSEQMARQLSANRFSVFHEGDTESYDVAIVNTCGFIDKAKEESVYTILAQVALKKAGKVKKVYVTGCLSARYKTELMESIPEVDAFFGTMELPNLLRTLNADYKTDLLGERLLYTPKHYAYLKISEGCNRTCAFCAIPLMRGGHISKPIEKIITEAEHLVQNGVKEIILIAQELTYYGLDIYKKRKLAELLEQLSAIENLHWIRLHYAYPAKFPLDVLSVMKSKSNICNYLDMPLQHISDSVLRTMKRGITPQETTMLINDIRAIIPNITLRTTFLVGFPGETERDILLLRDYIIAQKFDRIGVFTYSHEENTGAQEYQDTITQKEKDARAKYIMDTQRTISIEKNRAKIGSLCTVLIDKKEAGKFIGRTEADSPEVDNEVIVNPHPDIRIGDFISARIINSLDYDLIATLEV